MERKFEVPAHGVHRETPPLTLCALHSHSSSIYGLIPYTVKF